MGEQTTLSRLSRYWVLGCFVALVLIGFTHLQFFESHPNWALFIREVAFALFIACVFGLTIERIQRGEFVRLVMEERGVLKKDVFVYAYGHNIPDDVKKEIREKVLNQVFYCRNLTLEWEFSLAPGQPESLLVKKAYSYEFINASGDDREWPFRFTQLGADDLEALAESKFKGLKVQRKNGKPELIRAEDMEGPQLPGEPHKRQFSTVIKMKAQEEVKVYYEITLKRGRLSGDDTYNRRVPIIGRTTVRLRFPTAPAFDVTVNCKGEALKEGPDSDPPSRYSFYMDEGLLPFQGIAISWSPKEQKGQEGADAALPQTAS